MDPFSALLISNDPSAVDVSDKILDGFDVKADLAKSAPDMAKLMEKRRYDLAIYDQDVPGATELASSPWTYNRPRLLMAMVRNGKVKELRGRPIHLIIAKPFSPDLFIKSIRAAYSLIVKDRRTAYRCPIQVDASSARVIDASGGQALENIKLINISQSGMRIHAEKILPRGTPIAVEFVLPESKKIVRSKGTVIWSDNSGTAGIKFGDIPALDQKNLCEWLSVRTPPDFELAPKPGARRRIDSLCRQ